jgi:two-component system phosphate regulon sensor histidine kinase PhoR
LVIVVEYTDSRRREKSGARGGKDRSKEERVVGFFFFTRFFTGKRGHTRAEAGGPEGSEAFSARKEAETARLQLQFVLNAVNDGVLALDSRLRLTAANRKAGEIFGLDEAAVCSDCGRGLSLLEATRSTELEKLARDALSRGVPLTKDMRFYTSCAERSFRVSAAPFRGDAAEGGWAAALVFGERTNLRKLERVRKDFAANVSHELRTPIQAVKGFAETLLESPLEEPVRRYIGIILKNALVMEALTGDLLCLVSLEEDGAPALAMPETLIRPLLAEALSAAELPARDKRITLSLECPADLAADLHGPLMSRGVINLLDNAVKYSPPGSAVRVAAAPEAGDLVITVRDQGVGIPAKHLPRIFERFYRVDAGRSRGQGGVGLGLAIVRHIARVHQGEAEAESHAGEGSVFTIRIPLKQPKASLRLF